MGKEFYSSDAVQHPIDTENFETTFETAMKQSPFVRLLMIEGDDEQTVGYALLSLTYSNEAGGMVVLIEELQINAWCRGRGYGSELFNFLEQEYPRAKRFRLEVSSKNTKAIDLYKKLGYELFEYVQMVKDL